MNRTRTGCCVLLLVGVVLLAASPVMALPVTGLYSHDVAVSDQSDAERGRAFREALEAVFVKVTGDERWLQNSRLQQALDNAQNYVAGISYRSEPMPPPTGDVGVPLPQTTPRAREQNYLNVGFASDLVDQLLSDAGVPIWDSSRPGIMVWLALQDANGERRFLNPVADQEIVNIMQEFSTRRGVPIMFPLLDFEDRRNLSPDTVWALDEEAILQASARYDADSVLAGRVHFTPSGELVGLWKFIFQDQRVQMDSVEDNLADYIGLPLARATEQLANHFATVRNSFDRQRVRVHVDGVLDLSDYAGLMNYLQSMGLVNSVTPRMIDGNQLELEVDVTGSGLQLNELILLDRNLMPVAGVNSDRPGMHYRWTR
ncbi:MAG: DUF2066 domain-containing protein [Pseudohongiellaceae bacterium]